MSEWTEHELDAIAQAQELEISSRRRDGSLTTRMIIAPGARATTMRLDPA